MHKYQKNIIFEYKKHHIAIFFYEYDSTLIIDILLAKDKIHLLKRFENYQKFLLKQDYKVIKDFSKITYQALPRNANLENMVRQENNEQAWLVYGDWLQIQGDVRGELIAVFYQDNADTTSYYLNLLRENIRKLLGSALDNMLQYWNFIDFEVLVDEYIQDIHNFSPYTIFRKDIPIVIPFNTHKPQAIYILS